MPAQGLAQAPEPAKKRVVTQAWATNSAFVSQGKGDESGNKTAAIDKQTPQGGNQLYVNDYVVNVSGSSSYS